MKDMMSYEKSLSLKPILFSPAILHSQKHFRM